MPIQPLSTAALLELDHEPHTLTPTPSESPYCVQRCANDREWGPSSRITPYKDRHDIMPRESAYHYPYREPDNEFNSQHSLHRKYPADVSLIFTSLEGEEWNAKLATATTIAGPGND
ncbi:hypothetical protein B2J93_7648 [Marssonina coronariae]|uniref:Uncharacterized protein n=1 Tax=Diplocarpon coronariae TaxID=2795749 RepID=A0A218ZBN8_9HELO|nr:hypothetical protein B2J93_7648 [Marssonina coronariae]